MKILVVTDHYYPDIHGGYEVGCSLVTEELMRRGHDITVLTSDFNAPAIAERKNIFRILPCSKSQVNSYFLNIMHSLYKEIKSFFILKRSEFSGVPAKHRGNALFRKRFFDLVKVSS